MGLVGASRWRFENTNGSGFIGLARDWVTKKWQKQVPLPMLDGQQWVQYPELEGQKL